MTVKYPHVKVQLTGQDGNAFAIISRIRRAILNTPGPHGGYGRSMAAASQWVQEATECGSYDELLALAMETVTVI